MREARLQGLALGRLRVAAWGPQLGEWRVSSGASIRVRSVGTKQEVRRWEDPESTMGMGRDVHEWTETVPGDPFQDAAYQGETLAARQARQLRLGRQRIELEGYSPGVLVGSERGCAIVDPPYRGPPRVRLFRASAPVAELVQPARVQALALDARHLVVGLRDGRLRCYDAETGQEREQVRLEDERRDFPRGE